jgi:D-alanyl-D-alanine carboxypeptidase (penicillin-binding protein 5/6)
MIPTARRLASVLLLVMVALAATAVGRPAAAQIPYINALFNEPRYAAIVVDANTGEVLYAKNADSPRYPASLTKIMTLYLTFEALQSGRLSLDDTLTISAHANSMPPTKLALGVGAQIRVDDAIRAIAVKSANDMAVALAERLGGSEERFAALMTLRAQELGMRNTHYANASGLPDRRQLMSARDIALLSRAVMRDYPQYYSYFGIHRFVYRGEVMNNHNHLLDSMPGVDGLKTGYTNASGYNLSASAVRDGHRLIAVVLGGNSWAARDNNVADLLNTGFEVLRRRAKGENITVAQSLFEPEPTGPLVRPEGVEQGDTESSGLHIQMGDAPEGAAPAAEPARPEKVSAVRRACRMVRETRVVRRHGRKHKVVETVRSCRAVRYG